MKNLILLVLTVICIPSSADMRLVLSTEKEIISMYAETLYKEKIIRRAWFLTELKRKRDDETRSVKSLEEHDCREHKYRLLHFSHHTEFGGKGVVILDGAAPDTEYRLVSPNTVGWGVHEFLCEL
jgi:hypothetical protein